MLIDYHLHNHFSPDSREDTRKIVKRAIEMGMQEICITNHIERHDQKTGKSIFNFEEARQRFRLIKEEIKEVQSEFPELPIKFGAELEYVEDEGRMTELARFVGETDFDFILGSVHIVSNVIIASHLFSDALFSKVDEETAYKAYFENLMKLVQWGHFDAVAHFDICKKNATKFYGPFNPEKYKDQIIPILELMKEKGIGIELNTKSLHNKCNEIFPHPTILKWALTVGIQNFTLSSDAHRAKHVSEYIGEARETAKKAGIKFISTYDKRVSRPNLIK